jgi:MSHA biogenesis protein MshI
MNPFHWPWAGTGAQGWTALDIGADGSLIAVSVRKGSTGRPQVMKCARHKAGGAVAEALAAVAHEAGVSGYPWVLALQRDDYQMLVMAEPPVLSDEMERSVRWALGAMIDYPVDEAQVVCLPIPTTALQAHRARQIYAIVVRHTVIQAQQALFQKCKLNLQAVDVRETAQRNIAALLEKKGQGLGLVHIAQTGVHITFTYGGELYLDRFIKQALADMLAAGPAQREAMFELIALQVSRSVDFIARNFPLMQVHRLVLAPLPQQLGLRAYLAANLALTVEPLDLAQVFDLSLTPELATQDGGSDCFIALGCALRCMDNTA